MVFFLGIRNKAHFPATGRSDITHHLVDSHVDKASFTNRRSTNNRERILTACSITGQSGIALRAVSFKLSTTIQESSRKLSSTKASTLQNTILTRNQVGVFFSTPRAFICRDKKRCLTIGIRTSVLDFVYHNIDSVDEPQETKANINKSEERKQYCDVCKCCERSN